MKRWRMLRYGQVVRGNGWYARLQIVKRNASVCGRSKGLAWGGQQRSGDEPWQTILYVRFGCFWLTVASVWLGRPRVRRFLTNRMGAT